MRICPTCSSTAFEDMAICYGCLEPFEANAAASLAGVAGIQGSSTYLEFFSTEDELAIEEPPDGSAGAMPPASPVYEWQGTALENASSHCDGMAVPAYEQPDTFHFHIAGNETHGYDVYMLRKDGQELTIGQEHDSNNLPLNEYREPWMLQVCFTQGQMWAENKYSCHKATTDGEELSAARVLHPGDTIWVGGCKIEFIG